MSKQETGNEKYKGAGRVLGTFGGMSLGAIPGNIVAVTGQVMQIFGARTAGLVVQVIGGIAALGGAIAGGITGYRKAKAGQEQFADNQQALERAGNEPKITPQEMALLQERMRSGGQSNGYAATEVSRRAEGAQSTGLTA